jgi:hypothetical protein
MSRPVLRSLFVRLALATCAIALVSWAPSPRAGTCTTTVAVQLVLTSGDAAPLRGVAVEAWTSDGKAAGVTDESGRVSLRLPARTCGPARIQLRAPDMSPPLGGSLPVVDGAVNTFGQGGPQVMSASVAW